MQPSIIAKRAWLLLFIGFATFYLWGLGSLPLIGPDEPRYAQVAREMLARRDLITPTLGGIPWFEKPPLLYWLMMLSYRLFGINEYAARFGPALCGLITGVFIWWIGTHVTEFTKQRHNVAAGAGAGAGIGRWAALVWLSSFGADAFSRAASFDIVLTMSITGAFAFFLALEARTRDNVQTTRKRDLTSPGAMLAAGFYFFTGLSFLAKGLIGFVIIFGVVALYYIIRRERPRGTIAKSLIWGIPLSCAVVAVWFVPMVSRHGWIFVDQFIVQHHFARFVTNKYHHPGPIYFYLPAIIGLAMPWTMVLGAAIFSARRWSWRGLNAVDRLRLFALVWLIFPVLFFSFSGSKLIGYILPVVPAVALLVGERIACAISAERGQKILRLTGALLIALAIAGSWYLKGVVAFSCVLFMALPLVLAGIMALIRPQLRASMFVLVAVAVMISWVVGLKCAAPPLARMESVRELLATAATRGYSSTPVVQLHTIERTAEFYASGRITYGKDGEPIKFEGVPQVVEAARQSGGVVLCFVPREFESQLITFTGARTEIIGENEKVALIAVHQK